MAAAADKTTATAGKPTVMADQTTATAGKPPAVRRGGRRGGKRRRGQPRRRHHMRGPSNEKPPFWDKNFKVGSLELHARSRKCFMLCWCAGRRWQREAGPSVRRSRWGRAESGHRPAAAAMSLRLAVGTATPAWQGIRAGRNGQVASFRNRGANGRHGPSAPLNTKNEDTTISVRGGQGSRKGAGGWEGGQQHETGAGCTREATEHRLLALPLNLCLLECPEPGANVRVPNVLLGRDVVWELRLFQVHVDRAGQPLGAELRLLGRHRLDGPPHFGVVLVEEVVIAQACSATQDAAQGT